MLQLTATIQQFAQQGEKTGWTYILIPAADAAELNPNNKKSFNVKGKIDSHPITQLSLIPMGGGDYILTLNSALRKALGKRKGATVQLSLAKDNAAFAPPADLVDCLTDEPAALAFFNSMPPSHQKYFCKWIDAVKGEEARSRRIAQTVTAMTMRQNYAQMIHWQRAQRGGN